MSSYDSIHRLPDPGLPPREATQKKEAPSSQVPPPAASGVGRKVLKEKQSNKPSVVPRSPPFNAKHLEKEAFLKWGGFGLLEISRKSPIKPLLGNNENDVYITNANNGNPNVVFKKGKQAALLAEVCYRLSRIAGLEECVVPAKKGFAHVVDSKAVEEKHPCMKVVGAAEGETQEVVVNMRNALPITVVRREKSVSHLPCTINGKELVLERQRNGRYKVCEISNPIDVMVSGEKAVKLCSLGEEPKEYFLIDPRYVYDIFEKEECEYLSIDSAVYKIHETGGKITLECVKKSKIGNEEVEKSEYVRMDVLDPEDPDHPFEVIVSKKNAIPIELDFEVDENDESFQFTYAGSQYAVSREEDLVGGVFTYSVEKVEEESEEEDLSNKIINETFTLVEGENSTLYFLIPESGVISKEEEGMVQMKVENTFDTPLNTKSPLDILTDTPARKEFFDNIDTLSFIDCFIATILLRPQDGKIGRLGESNVLFQEIPGTDAKPNTIGLKNLLRPIIIDNDETMPPNNKVSTTIFGAKKKGGKGKSGNGKNVVHPVRNGLMAFPQAERVLENQEKAHALAVINKIILHKKEIEKYLETVSKKEMAAQSTLFDQDKVKACIEIIDSLEKFVQENEGKDWSLQELFFAVFPEYKVHWNAIQGATAAVKAEKVGCHSLEELESFKR